MHHGQAHLAYYLTVCPAVSPSPTGDTPSGLTEHALQSHRPYRLPPPLRPSQMPLDPGEAQEELDIRREASLLVQIKNPEDPAPQRAVPSQYPAGFRGLGEKQTPRVDPELMVGFENASSSQHKRFTSNEDVPRLLEIPGIELLLIAATTDVVGELGGAAGPGHRGPLRMNAGPCKPPRLPRRYALTRTVALPLPLPVMAVWQNRPPSSSARRRPRCTSLKAPKTQRKSWPRMCRRSASSTHPVTLLRRVHGRDDGGEASGRSCAVVCGRVRSWSLGLYVGCLSVTLPATMCERPPPSAIGTPGARVRRFCL